LKLRSGFHRAINSRASLNLLYVPALALFMVFIIYPFFRGIFISFTDWNGYSSHFRWVGLEKYATMLTDRNIGKIVVNTFIYGCGSTFFQNLLGLAYALFLDRKIRGVGLVRTAVYLPVIIAPLVMGYIWYFMFQLKGGAINDILMLLGLTPVDFLVKGRLTVWLITGINTYQYMGFAMMIYLAGLQTVPKEYYEAATLDGAHGPSLFAHITLPMLMPSITVNIVANLIGGLKLFDVIVATTNGGPGYETQSLSTIMYQLYFSRLDAGYAAAVGAMMFAIITTISVVSILLLRRREVAQ
jgi:raffinose/stachyose/melibiose transport system permease protein